MVMTKEDFIDGMCSHCTMYDHSLRSCENKCKAYTNLSRDLDAFKDTALQEIQGKYMELLYAVALRYIREAETNACSGETKENKN
jgi:predicted DsbA family dithiol-disulfide isomerase